MTGEGILAKRAMVEPSFGLSSLLAPFGGEGLGVRGRSVKPLTLNPSPPKGARGEGHALRWRVAAKQMLFFGLVLFRLVFLDVFFRVLVEGVLAAGTANVIGDPFVHNGNGAQAAGDDAFDFLLLRPEAFPQPSAAHLEIPGKDQPV